MISQTPPRPAETGRRRPPGRRAHPLLAGGTDGNERLTVLGGLLLIVLFAVLGVTIIRIGQLLWLHLFLGLLLIGPVALKLASTGYRFVRYYTHELTYRRKGPPPPALRLLAPLLVALTAAVFVTGVALLLLGPSSRQPLVLLHKVSFIAWVVIFGIHILGHLPEVLGFLGGARETRAALVAMRGGGPEPDRPQPSGARIPGANARRLALVSALVAGAVVAIALLPDFAAWTHGFHHGHH